MNLQIPDCNKFFTVPAENLQNMKETKIIFNFFKKKYWIWMLCSFSIVQAMVEMLSLSK